MLVVGSRDLDYLGTNVKKLRTPKRKNNPTCICVMDKISADSKVPIDFRCALLSVPFMDRNVMCPVKMNKPRNAAKVKKSNTSYTD